MKKILLTFLIITLFLSACKPKDNTAISGDAITLTDAFGNKVSLLADAKIASCYASFAECLQLAGIDPVGVTEDAVSDHGLEFSDDTVILGTVKEINLEKVIALNPDYLILSADLTAHTKLEQSLKSAGIKYGYYRVDTFSDYAVFMKQLCDFSDRDDLYAKNVTEVKNRIVALLEKIPDSTDKNALLLRVYSTGVKAKRDDNLAGQILKELGVSNIADANEGFLEDLSVEQIIKENPDYIFALSMGAEAAAKEYLSQNFENNPAFTGLDSVKNKNYVFLPKDLFHYKPNNRWDESYEYLAKIIYPEIFK